ncbi:MAG TPA: Fic family protein, partial [Bacilli bacterium]|nr:Fic family protein [Bacilli bacterium]
MANSDLSVRFTDETYATRSDVMRALNTSLIDSIWRNIEEYRSRFSRILSLGDIAKRPFRVTFTPNITDKITGLERKFARAMSQFSQLDRNDSERVAIQKESYRKILAYLAQKNNIVATDVDIMAIVTDQNFNSAHQGLVDYYKTLRHFEQYHHDPIDDNFLADFLARFKGEDELVSFYREKDYARPYQTVIGKEYDFAPAATIEFLMNDLFDFINNSEISFVVKAVAAYYFIDYVKPFENHNEEVAIILAKSILAHNDIGDVSAFLPLEALFAMRNENFRKIFLEVQKTNDLTYALLAVIDLVLNEVQNFLDLITQVKMTEVKKEYRSLGSELPAAKPASEPKPEPKAVVKEEPAVASKGEKVRPAEVVAVPQPLELPKEEDVKSIIKNLLESNPLLRPKQAEFYARHRTLGKYYTISMYKKEMDVVYETARTSMDYLAQLGYYRRENVKNKFVYTPIK